MGELGLGGASDELLRDLKAEILRFMEHLQNIDAPAIPHHVQLLGSQLLLHQQLIQLLVLQHRLRMKFRLHSILFLSICHMLSQKERKLGRKWSLGTPLSLWDGVALLFIFIVRGSRSIELIPIPTSLWN